MFRFFVEVMIFPCFRMCGDRYFQIFDDLLLTLGKFQYCELENEGKFSGGPGRGGGGTSK